MLVIAHRGASGHAPENTMAAFLRALAMGAPAIELDVHQTLDHELVVAHDDDLKRCGRDKRRIKNLHWHDISGLDVGSWFDKSFTGERLPRLEDVFDILPKTTELHIEIKRGSLIYPGIEERVVDMIHKRGALARVVVSSFDHAALYSVRSLDEKVRIGYLMGLTTLQTALREMKDIDAESLNLSVRQTLARTVKATHERGRKILVYTVNTPVERDRLNTLGVDGIFCNYPELNLWR